MVQAQLSRRERMQRFESHSWRSPHAENPEQLGSWRQYLGFSESDDRQAGPRCRLVSKVEQTDTKLESLQRDPRHIIGYGLMVKLNDHNERLLLDTGASGILIGRKAAEKAGLTRISARSLGGIGDKGLQSGYIAVADHIRVGDLEFEDCVVHVSDRGSITDEDGLIGSNVFASYLIDIDMPAAKLRLSPLPKRPDEASAPGDSERRRRPRTHPRLSPTKVPRTRVRRQGSSRRPRQVTRRPSLRAVCHGSVRGPGDGPSGRSVFHFGHTLAACPRT